MQAPAPAEVRAVPELRRSLGLVSVALFLVVACSNLQWVATAANAGPSAVTIWLLGLAVMFVPLSVVVIALSHVYPEEGGMYVWTKAAFGPFAGFITGWMYWICNLPYFAALLYFTAGNALYITGGSGGALEGSALYFIVASIAGLALGTIMNVLGLGVGKWLINVGAVSRWTVTLLLLALGAFAWVKFGPAVPINTSTLRPSLSLTDIIFWSVIAFAWTGPEGAPLLAGEIKNPRRAIPLGLALAAPAVAVIYIGGTLAVLAAIPPAAVNTTSGVVQAISSVATKSGWQFLTPIAAALIALSCLGSVGAWLGAAARLPFVAGIDHFLPSAFGKIDPRWGSPVIALVTQAVVSAVFIVLGQSGDSVKGAYHTLVDATVIVTLIPFLLIFGAAMKVFTQARTGPDLLFLRNRFVVVAAGFVGFVTTLIAIALAFIPPADTANKTLYVVRITLITALVVGSGIVLYVNGMRKRASQPPTPVLAYEAESDPSR